jgi:hypothetical protein
MLGAMPRLSHFGLHGVAGGRSPSEAVTLGSFTIDLADWNDIFAGTTDVRLSELYIPRVLLQRDPKSAEVFGALDFERLVLGLSLDQDWSPSEGTADLTLTKTIENGADITVSYSIAGLTEEWVYQAIQASQDKDNEIAMMALLGQLGLSHLAITVDDKSLVDRAFKAAVVMQGLQVDAQEYKRQTQDALPLLLSSLVPPLIAGRIIGPVQAFLEGGRKLVAQVAPPEPILLPELMGGLIDPVGVLDRLQLTITTE